MDDKEVTSGMTKFCELPDDKPCESLVYLESLDCAYALHGSSYYKICNDGSFQLVGRD